MIVLSAADSQIVLYAKGHFGHDRDNYLEDLRILVGKRAGMEPQHVTDQDVVAVLTVILDELNLKMDYRFIRSVVFGEFWQKDRTNPVQNFIHAALGLIQGMPVKDQTSTLVEIQPRDPNALSPTVSVE